MTHRTLRLFALGTCLSLAACGDASPDGETSQGGGAATTTGSTTTTTGSTTTGSTTGTNTSTGDCPLTADTTPTATVNAAGCHVLERDTSACEGARKAAGIDGYWLDFSCRVSLSTMAGVIKAASDGQPDYESNYFPASNACHADFAGGIQNPNQIVPKSYVIQFPLSPDTASHTMMGTAVVGLAVNGVPIYGDFAAPGDDIFKEAKTFDACSGHPQMSGSYHYHAEPHAISNDDAAFIGVMRDGYPIYGRKDMDGSYPTLDATGGHTGATAHSAGAAVYHYHVNLQTSTTPGTAGEQQWFLTAGSFRGTPAACGSCN